ncbi:aminotransferase [Adhaeribacter arboris]|uniref:Aminotransferase n=1 Tax=Adhaeribacter arboris TaxID=2072846 RepID=A0A2T2YK11_9BACT|nr:methionine aminotransferase [Adhaeribacter arboris]PSR55805.1 aminotransferase [Adhaeribacter arboris]
MILPSKLPQIGTSIFTVMSQLAQQHGAINLSQGFPDFNCPPELTDLVSYYLKQGYNQYAPMAGVLKLREQISSKTEKMYGFSPNPDTEITITSGATEALYAALAAILRSGDEVIVLEPAYDSYVPAILLNGGKPVFVPLQVPSFKIDWQLVKAAITTRTRAILLNSPHNPSGAILSASDLTTLAELVGDTNIVIISDEVYEHMVFDSQPHLSLLTQPELAGRSFVISSFGKTYHATGWKVAYCVAPPTFTTEFRKVHQYLTFSTVTPIQYALADFLDNQEHYLTLPAFYQAKRDLFHHLLQDSGFTLKPSAGTYFQLVSYENITQESDLEFARRLTTEVGVAAIPISVFYHQQTDHGLLRFCFAKNEDTLQAAAEKLCRL